MNRLLSFATLALLAGAAGAQVPEEFTNLQILPEDVDRRELVGIMRNFAGDLGVRCNHCHVGEDPDDLQGYDFASDEKETKRIARVMLRMTREINETHLPATGRAELTEVTCMTCHRRVLDPRQLSDLVLEAIDEGGVDAGISRYRELRESSYGGAAYDFTDFTLNRVAETLARERRDLDSALAINGLNLEFHPESLFTLSLRSRIQNWAGDRAGAIATLEKAAALHPDVEWLRATLERLKAPPAEEE